MFIEFFLVIVDYIKLAWMAENPHPMVSVAWIECVPSHSQECLKGQNIEFDLEIHVSGFILEICS